MKRINCLKIILLIVLVENVLFPYKQVHGINQYKELETIEKDTTGKGVNDKIKILTDEKEQGYIVEITQNNGKRYILKPGLGDNNCLAPFAGFMKLNIIVSDVNNDSLPEIITWGSLTHENNIYMFQWNGSDYRVVFDGFYSDFYFKDITGDKVLELVIENRLYGTGYEHIYLQWQKGEYKKINYDLDAGRGFEQIKSFIGIMSYPGENTYIFEHPQSLKGTFTEGWISNESNIEYLKKLKSEMLSIQILEYMDEKLEWGKGYSFPIKDNWRFKVIAYKIHGTKIYPEERILEVETKLSDAEKKDYKIDYIRIK